MKITHNIAALNTHRQLSFATHAQMKSMEKLSSGLRINRAGDDAAGLAISEKMRAQIRGLDQAARNIQDAISLVQVADGGMREIHSLLQRGRELSVQASNDTLTATDRKSIQKEVDNITKVIDNISNTTHFNTINLLKSNGLDNIMQNGTDDEKLMYLLKNGILSESERLVKSYFGIEADGANLNISLKDLNDSNVLARVTYYVDPVTGKGENVSMELDKADFLPLVENNMGGSDPIYNDRVVAHELTHAIMARSMDFGELPKWFKEGAAEFLHGGDERLAGDLWNNGEDNQDIVNTIGDGTDSTWSANSKGYSSGYVAVRYLHDRIKAAGGSGIKDVMTYLSTNTNSTLDDALKNISRGSYTGGLTEFISDYKANGATYITDRIDLTNSDTGAIGGEDADGGMVKTASSVIEDGGNYSDDPLKGFNEIWLDSDGNAIPESERNPNSLLSFQIGANESQQINMSLFNMTAGRLGIKGADVVTDASGSISLFDDAIQIVSSERSRSGAIQNRLEHSLTISQNSSENLTSAESRIRDVDMAHELMNQTKSSILSQAAQAILAQANQHPQGVLQLLR